MGVCACVGVRPAGDSGAGDVDLTLSFKQESKTQSIDSKLHIQQSFFSN